MDAFDDLSAESILAHFAEEEKPHGAVVPPIFQNSLFLFDDVGELMDRLSGKPGEAHIYSRVSNPTLDVVERKIARLEGADACKVTGSGMAAISCAALSALETGSHCVVVDTAYGPLRQFLSSYMTRFGVTVDYVEGSSPAEVLDAIRPETSLIYLESPGSFAFRLQDFAVICDEARRRGITTIADNTYSTPLYQQPARFGVDIVVHSATKYLGGHSDLVAGAICANQARIDRITHQEISLLGSILAPLPAWLLNRGMRTLGLRLKHHESCANAVAGWLEQHDRVDRVIHVGLASHPQRDLIDRQMSGSGGLFAFHPKSHDRDKIVAFCNALELFGRGVSWGGHESLVIPTLAHPLAYGEPTWFIRLYCGLESPRDLIRDVQNAFQVSGL